MCAKRQTNKSPLIGVVQKLQTFVDVQKSTLEDTLWLAYNSVLEYKMIAKLSVLVQNCARNLAASSST